MLDHAKQGAPKRRGGLDATERARTKEDVRVASIEGPPELKPTMRKFRPDQDE